MQQACNMHCFKQCLIRRCLNANGRTDGLTQDVGSVERKSYVSHRVRTARRHRGGFGAAVCARTAGGVAGEPPGFPALSDRDARRCPIPTTPIATPQDRLCAISSPGVWTIPPRGDRAAVAGLWAEPVRGVVGVRIARGTRARVRGVPP